MSRRRAQFSCLLQPADRKSAQGEERRKYGQDQGVSILATGWVASASVFRSSWQVPAQAYSLEAANPRHEHEWRVWERVRLPPGKILIPGVITHHIVTVEHPQVIADRIVRFARIVGRENVIAGSDCGFAQQETLARVHPKVMWAKFEALAAGARLATTELWGRAAA
jgi:methionine synthase II (cobalamin-independent)